MTDAAGTMEQIGSAAIAGMVVDTLYIAAAVAAIAFVWRLTTMQETYAAMGTMPGRPQPSPEWGRHAPQNAAGH